MIVYVILVWIVAITGTFLGHWLYDKTQKAREEKRLQAKEEERQRRERIKPWFLNFQAHLVSYPHVCKVGETLRIDTPASGVSHMSIHARDPINDEFLPVSLSYESGFVTATLTMPDQPGWVEIQREINLGFGPNREYPCNQLLVRVEVAEDNQRKDTV